MQQNTNDSDDTLVPLMPNVLDTNNGSSLQQISNHGTVTVIPSTSNELIATSNELIGQPNTVPSVPQQMMYSIDQNGVLLPIIPNALPMDQSSAHIDNNAVNEMESDGKEMETNIDFSDWINATETRIKNVETNFEHFKTSVAEVLDKILQQTTRIEKFIENFVREKGDVEPSVSTAHVNTEEFDDLDNNLPIKTVEQLDEFEKRLSDEIYKSRFIRFLSSKFTMNGFVNGATFFTEAIRFLIRPNVFLSYSWKGQKRDGVSQTSFETKHKVFVDFFKKIVRIADKSKSSDDVNGMFANVFRYKKQNAKREEHPTTCKKPSARNRPSGRRDPENQLINNDDELTIDDNALTNDGNELINKEVINNAGEQINKEGDQSKNNITHADQC